MHLTQADILFLTAVFSTVVTVRYLIAVFVLFLFCVDLDGALYYTALCECTKNDHFRYLYGIRIVGILSAGS